MVLFIYEQMFYNTFPIAVKISNMQLQITKKPSGFFKMQFVIVYVVLLLSFPAEDNLVLTRCKQEMNLLFRT